MNVIGSRKNIAADIFRRAGADNLLELMSDVLPDACWIDGKKCPYSSPQGRLILASPGCCRTCQRLSEYSYALKELVAGSDIKNEITEEFSEAVKEELNESAQNLSELLHKLVKGKDPLLEDLVRVLNAELSLKEVLVVVADDIEAAFSKENK